MTDAATKLLATFEKLPREEQHEVLTQMLRRSPVFADSQMSEEALTTLADSVFQALDDEEANGDASQSR